MDFGHVVSLSVDFHRAREDQEEHKRKVHVADWSTPRDMEHNSIVFSRSSGVAEYYPAVKGTAEGMATQSMLGDLLSE